MPASLQELITQFRRRAIELDDFKSRLLAEADANPQTTARTLIALRQAVDAQQLGAEAGVELIAAIETKTLINAANTRTRADDGTQVRAAANPKVVAGAAHVEFAPGAVIKERFLLQEQIGCGGMGIVFSAIDRRKTEAHDPNPWVAIKILNADFARHPHALIALQREARKAQTLAHPNVATVFDFDRDGDAVFMSMELLRGRSLDAVVREASGAGIGREAALPIIRGIAEGLAYAHRKGIVHSDLKPGNVFLLEDGTPKILDFGIARAVPSTAASDEPRDLFDAAALGAYTEAYATAEMIAGTDPHPADDVYALGLIAYELLTGFHPYKRYGAAKARELGVKIAAPKGLRRREWRVLERSLSLERKERPRDAADFLRQLSGVTRLQQSLIAASAVLAIAAGYLGYRSYQEAGPAISFEQLPAETQQQFKSYMDVGNESWLFYEKEKNVMALQDAIDQFDAAYKLHPRNRDATRALQKSADAALDGAKSDPERQREFAKMLSEHSDYLAKYSPVVAASK